MVKVYDTKDVKLFIDGKEIKLVGEVRISSEPSLLGGHYGPKFAKIEGYTEMAAIEVLSMEFKGTPMEGE